LRDNNKDCKTIKQCRKKKSTFITDLWDCGIDFSLEFALNPWEEVDLGSGLCSSCVEDAKMAYNLARIINWDDLKANFGLDDLEADSDPEALDTDSSEAWDTDTDSDF
jgi:hypothetical protein